MRVLAIAALAVLVAGTACANPILGNWLYIDFDPPNYVHSVSPAAYSTVDAYVMLSHIDNPTEGFTTISFRLEMTPGMYAAESFTSLLPGGLSIGTWDAGITLASTECMTVFPCQIGRLTFVYMGAPGNIGIVDHPDYPRWLVDCQEPGQVEYYCVYYHGGVGQPGTLGDCGVNPVEDVSWSALKALYR